MRRHRGGQRDGVRDLRYRDRVRAAAVELARTRMLVCVERREAPHPYVTGVRAPSQGARRTLARFATGASQAPGRLPALHVPLCGGKLEKDAVPARECSAGGEALAV